MLTQLIYIWFRFDACIIKVKLSLEELDLFLAGFSMLPPALIACSFSQAAKFYLLERNSFADFWLGLLSSFLARYEIYLIIDWTEGTSHSALIESNYLSYRYCV